MKLQHVRMVAVVAVVLVALTGARKSGGGGGCDNDSKRRSHSSSVSDNNRTTGGSGGQRDRSAASDISVADCAYQGEEKQLAATLRIKNGSTSSYVYRANVKFLDGAGLQLGSAPMSGFQVPAGQTRTTTVTAGYTGSGDGSELSRCEVMNAVKR